MGDGDDASSVEFYQIYDKGMEEIRGNREGLAGAVFKGQGHLEGMPVTAAGAADTTTVLVFNHIQGVHFTGTGL